MTTTSRMTGSVIALLFCLGLLYFSFREEPEISPELVPKFQTGSQFLYHFDSQGLLSEAQNVTRSTSPYWWLDSGGLLSIKDGFGHTVAGEAPAENYWRQLYAQTSPTDTDNGSHPQNLFRLITRSHWYNFTQEIFFRINQYHLSSSLNRNESNGLLLMNRYVDGNNLYYAGIRVDGLAVIKKKVRGTYYTLGQTQIFPGNYHRENNPNLLPVNEWIGLRSRTTTLNGEVKIELFMKRGLSRGEWDKILEATDNGQDTKIIDARAPVGIRTDFMDVSFESFAIKETNSLVE